MSSRFLLLVTTCALLLACSGDGESETSATQGAGGGGASGGEGTGGSGTGGTSSMGGSGTGASGGSSTGGGSGQGGAGGAGNSCIWVPGSNPCRNGFYCDAINCGGGTCQPVPNNDEQAGSPVCGCDNVTYWNANTAAAHGMPEKAAGACATTVACSGNDNCPQGRFCNTIVTGAGMCGAAAGTCWGLPETCNIADYPGLRPCSGSDQDCKSQCATIRSGQPGYADGGC